MNTIRVDVEYHGNPTIRDLVSAITQCHRGIDVVRTVDACPKCGFDMQSGVANVLITSGGSAHVSKQAAAQVFECDHCGYLEFVGDKGRTDGSIIVACGIAAAQRACSEETGI